MEEGSSRGLKLSGDPREEILQFYTQIVSRTTMLYERECKMEGMLRAIAFMVDCTEASKLVGRIKGLTQYWAKAAIIEEENKALHRECKRVRTDIRKAERESKEAKDRVDASGKALIEVKEALTLWVDLINKARLFDEKLEKKDKLNRRHIIRYLNDQAQKMERTWGQIQFVVKNLVLGGLVQQGTETQVGVTSFPALNTPTKPRLDEARTSKKATMD